MKNLIIILMVALFPTWVWGQSFDPVNPDEPSTVLPKADFYTNQYKSRVRFGNQSKDASRYEWDFGDGSAISKEKSPLHIYEKAGTYKVLLTAMNGLGKDTLSHQVTIEPVENWYMGNNVSLDRNSKDVYNYTSLDDLFKDLESLPYYHWNDITVNVARQQSFAFSSSVNLTELKDVIIRKIKEISNSSIKIKIVADSYSSGSIPILTLWPALTKANFDAYKDLSEYMEFSNVVIKFWDIPYSIYREDELEEETICSGSSVSRYFTNLCSAFTYDWKLVNVPKYITGYKETGIGNIQNMTLLNASSEMDTLVYEVRFRKDNEIYYTMNCKIAVCPKTEAVTLVAPAKDDIVSSREDLLFSWKPVVGASGYTLYYREVGTEAFYSEYAKEASLKPYYTSHFEYDKSYEWKVEVYTPCGTISSETYTFKMSHAPDLEIVSFSVEPQAVKPGQEFTFTATVRNSGTEAISAASWRDGLYEYNDTGYSSLLQSKEQESKSLEVDGEYEVKFTIKAPFEEGEELRYYIYVNDNGGLREMTRLNNRDSLMVTVALVTIPTSEYKALCALYQSAKGEEWYLNKRWNIESCAVSRSNWEGVTFDDEGHVLKLALSGKNLIGTIPAEIFTLPYLRELDLSGNRLSGKLEKVITDKVSADSLRSINLGNNQITGYIPKEVNLLKKLNNLQLSKNQIDSIEAVLPKVLSLDITSQTIHIDSIQLSVNPQLQIPAICRYDHESQSLGVYPDFTTSYSSTLKFEYNQGRYAIKDWYGANEVKIPSGQALTITQASGSAKGSHSPFKVFYDQGDANMDLVVDVLDIPHTLNYIMEDLEHTGYVIFNYNAANTFTDKLINVQDMVATVNIILGAPLAMRSSLRSANGEEIAHLTVEDGYLVLDNPLEPVVAMDVSLKGVKSDRLKLLFQGDNLMFTTRDTDEGTRFILLFMDRAGISTGKTKIMEVAGTDVAVTGAMLSDKAAKEIPVTFPGKKDPEEGTPTDIDTIDEAVLTNLFQIQIPENVHLIKISLYGLNGRLVVNKELMGVNAGGYSLREVLSGLSVGTYVLHVGMWTDKDVIEKKIKLYISK